MTDSRYIKRLEQVEAKHNNETTFTVAIFNREKDNYTIRGKEYTREQYEEMTQGSRRITVDSYEEEL
jgi:hypothetical protein